MSDTERMPPPVPGSYMFSSDSVPTTTTLPAQAPLVQHPSGSEGWLPTENARNQPKIESPALEPLTNNELNRVAGNTNEDNNTVDPTYPTASASSRNNQDDYVTYNPSTITDEGLKRGTTTSTNASLGRATSLGRSASRRTAHTASDGRLVGGSTFVNGAGATGPLASAEVEDEQTQRAKEAGASLTPKQKSKIVKDEIRNGKRLSKIIKSEGKMEKKALELAISELDDLQKVQKNTIKSEARLQEIQSKQTTALKKTEAAYLSARIRYEAAAAEAKATAEALETLRASSRKATEKMQDKSAEVDALRRTLAVDERERGVKLGELGGKRRGLWQ